MLNRGKFKKVGETISVQTGGTLELRCRGKPVQWGVPSYLEEDDEGRLRYSIFIYSYTWLRFCMSVDFFLFRLLQDCPTRAIRRSDISQHHWRRHRGVHLLPNVLRRAQTAGRSTPKLSRSSSSFLVLFINFIDADARPSQSCRLLPLFHHHLDGKPFHIHVLSYRPFAISSCSINQTHRNYLFHHRTTMRWFSWGPIGQRSSPARWRHRRPKCLCTVSFHLWRWRWMGWRSPLMSRKATP